MGIEQALADRPLLEAIALLSSRGESGRLKITDGAMRGAFFFHKGKLVDAHMGPFHGFQAVNLAVSMGRVRLGFDPSTQSRLSTFHAPYEREILKARFGIETADPKAAESLTAINHAATEASQTVQPPPSRSSGPVLGPQPPVKLPIVNNGQSEPAQTSSPVVLKRSSPPKLDRELQNREIVSLAHAGTDSSPRKKLVAGAGFVVFVLMVPATVALVSRWTSRSEAKLTESVPAASAVVMENTPGPEPIKPAANAEAKQPAVEENPAAPRKSAAEAASEALERAVSPSPALTRPVEKAKENASARPSEGPNEAEPAKPSSQIIAVVVEINEGQVTEAYVKTPQQGMAAYEATALRLARQRRFPKGTNRRETLNLQVTRER
jgi:hypothetical protein